MKVGDTKNVVLRCRWNSTSKKWISLGSGGSVTSSSTKFACTFKCIGTEWPVGQWKCVQCDSYESSKTTSGNTHLGYHITGAHAEPPPDATTPTKQKKNKAGTSMLQHFPPVMGLKQTLEEAGSISAEESHAVASAHAAATAVGTPPTVPAPSPSAKINSYSASVLQMQQLARGVSSPGMSCSCVVVSSFRSDHLWVNICFSYTSLTTQCHGQLHSVTMGLQCSTTPIVSYEGMCFLQLLLLLLMCQLLLLLLLLVCL